MSKWTRQHEQQRQRIQDKMAQKALPFEDLGEEARAERRALPFLQWCQTYLPHYFDRPFAPFHAPMVRTVAEPGMPTFIGAFRGAGKSALLALARPLWVALGGGCPYLLYGSQVQRLAAQNMDYVRLELDHNERIRADYGPIETHGREEEWTLELTQNVLTAGAAAENAEGKGDPQSAVSASSASAVRRSTVKVPSVKFEAFGIGMSPRGRRHRQYRPLEFVGDDLEDAELARNPRRQQNLWDWMMDEVLPALEPARYAFTVLGTMFGPGCMLERARELAQKRDDSGRPLAKLFIQPATRQGHSVWPERFPDGVLARVRATVGLKNWLRNYALCADDPTRPFQPAWMHTYREEALERNRLDVVCFLDPALSEAPTGCPRALVAVGADRTSGIRYVLDAWIERGSPMQMVEKLFAFNRIHRPRLIGIESNGGYALIKPLLQLECERRGEFLPVRYVNHTRPKAIRIESLCCAFESGRWRFPRNPAPGIRTLQEQFLSYPDGFVDGPDACAGCEELLPDPWRARQGSTEYMSLGQRTDFAHL